MTKELFTIKQTVESVFEVEIDNKRDLENMKAKVAYSYFATHYTNHSLCSIGDLINVDHSTVIHHRDVAYPSYLQSYKDFDQKLDSCHALLKENGWFVLRKKYLQSELEIAENMELIWLKRKKSLNRQLEELNVEQKQLPSTKGAATY